MQTYIRFITQTYLKAFAYVFFIMFGLVFILNTLGELDFFSKINVSAFYPAYLSLINTPSLIFEMLPFIFLLSTQLFFINIFKDNQINIFKYNGIKNTKIILLLSGITFVMSLLLVTFFYHASSNLKNIYLELKSNYTTDGKYLAVITKNGLWIKDKVGSQSLIIKASKINDHYLNNSFISIFDDKYNIVQNIKSDKIDISLKEWKIYDAKIFIDNNVKNIDYLTLKTSFDYELIQSLFSNLSSLSIIKLFELRNNYELLNYSTTEISVQIQKLFSYPVFLIFMTILSATIMLYIKNNTTNRVMLSMGLLISVLIYYINNFFYVFGNTEKIPVILSVWVPIFIFGLFNSILIYRINEK
jgi:lipopolysaccharide export system permease protein